MWFGIDCRGEVRRWWFNIWFFKKIFFNLLIWERQKHLFVVPLIYAFIGWFLYVLWPGIQLTTFVHQKDTLTPGVPNLLLPVPHLWTLLEVPPELFLLSSIPLPCPEFLLLSSPTHPAPGKMIFHETVLRCQKSWWLLMFYLFCGMKWRNEKLNNITYLRGRAKSKLWSSLKYSFGCENYFRENFLIF